MNSLDLLKMGMNNLWRRKTRTLLTILGVVIGTGSIVIMMSLSIAMEQSQREYIESMGSLNIIDVRSGRYYYDEDMNNRNKKKVSLDEKAVASFEKMEGVEAVMPIKSAYMKIGAGKMVGRADIMGIKPGVMEAFDFKAEEGRLLLDTDKEAMVFGKEVAFDFYNPRSRGSRYGRYDPDKPPVNLISNKLILTSDMGYGEKRRNRDRDPDYKPPQPHKVKGVGILEENDEWGYYAFMNIETLEKIIKEDERANRDNNRGGRFRGRSEEDKYEQIKVKVKDFQNVTAVQEKIKNMGYQAHSLTDALKSIEEQSKKMQAILGGIGAVSLLVAAIGITNTMVMSIYERTREIGVMKVLGAKLSDIQKLFLFEAAMIGFGGGLLGLGFSYGVSYLLNKLGANFAGEMGMGMGMGTGISVITSKLALMALCFSTVIGIIAGYSPARRAMKLSALEAIKNE